MGLAKTIRAIHTHPLNAHSGRLRAVGRFFRWQVLSRLHGGSVVVPFVNGARLLVSRGMTGATGNIYMGLHEFAEMAFVVHALRNDDLFVDVGANVGTYTVLAAAVAGANCVSVEPIPSTFEALIDNLQLNRIHDHVEPWNLALGESSGTVDFIANRDTKNRVALKEDSEVSARIVKVSLRRLDNLLAGREPTILKIDVEGYESQVIAGAGSVISRPSLVAVVMETNLSGRRYGVDETALARMMADVGFQPCTYEPFSRQLKPIEAAGQRQNTILVRDFDAVQARVSKAPAFTVLGQRI